MSAINKCFHVILLSSLPQVLLKLAHRFSRLLTLRYIALALYFSVSDSGFNFMICSCVSMIIGFQVWGGGGGLAVNRKNQKCLNLTPSI